MDKNFHFVSEIVVKKISRTIRIGAGIVLTLFVCDVSNLKEEDFVQTNVAQVTSVVQETMVDNTVAITMLKNETPVEHRSIANIEGGGLDVLEQFVSSILKDSRPLDGDISKFVSDHFWDLV